MKSLKETINESFLYENEEEPVKGNYAVVFYSRQLSDVERQTHHVNYKRCRIVLTDIEEDRAKHFAKESNKLLTKGEKQYFGMRYSAVPVEKLKELQAV